MSRLRELEQHRHRLEETREIMSSMQTLAFMETRKLAGFLDAQRAVVAHIHTVVEDFVSFYSETIPVVAQPTQVYLLLGSERGFCGDYNESLIDALNIEHTNNKPNSAWIIAVGSKLCVQFEKSYPNITLLPGASVVEDVENTLVQIVTTLNDIQAQNEGISFAIIHHDPDSGGVICTQVLPPFKSLRGSLPRFSYPPQLNFSPEKLSIELVQRYLFSTLHEILYLSLMAENQSRVSHLESAVQQLDDKSAALLRRSNTLRQEEITEEIEVILLSAASIRATSKAGK